VIRKIKLLSPTTINRIAAGEVVERPASAVKELIENSIDAGAKSIEITLHNAGRNLIAIIDDGCGMSKEELQLAIERHTTSKLDEDNLLNITNFGFRGEALPSIGSISRMTITSKQQDADLAWSIGVFGGEKQPLVPASLKSGTKIEVKDLFFATPARLKFLKSERTELEHVIEITNRLALSHHDVDFTLSTEHRTIIKTKKNHDVTQPSLDARGVRISEILGKEFIDNALQIDYHHQNMSLTGYASLPTFNRGTSSEQYLFVNNRPVRDKLLFTAVKVAYKDFLSNNRYPVVVLYLNIDNEEVDVNVHPAKTEVRFRDANHVKALVIAALKKALTGAAHRSSSSIATSAINSFILNIPFASPVSDNITTTYKESDNNVKTSSSSAGLSNLTQHRFNLNETPRSFSTSLRSFLPSVNSYNPTTQINEQQVSEHQEVKQDFPLGIARCQLHLTYIVAETEKSIVIVDQHAAHERLVYEKLKKSRAEHNILKQRLLIPEIVELDAKILHKIIKYKEQLHTLGITIDLCGETAVIVSEVPALIKQTNIKQLIKDIGDDFEEYDENITLNEIIEHILETFACHHSIRAGRTLNTHEMNALLREMEQTPYSGQCNHGRPTYIELKLSDIEKLFGRS
jgi:DNA mismatch repair protein MutL